MSYKLCLRLFTITLFACSLLVHTPVMAQVTYNVSIDTSGLIGHPAGPFSIDFLLLDGDGVANNSLT